MTAHLGRKPELQRSFQFLGDSFALYKANMTVLLAVRAADN